MILRNRDYKYISSLIDSIPKENANEKYLQTLKKHFNDVSDYNVDIEFSEQDYTICNKILDELETLTKDYTTLGGGSSNLEFERIKKYYISYLESLSTYREKLINLSNYYDEVINKEIRGRIVNEMVEEEGLSFTKADKLVYSDERYIRLRNKLYNFKKYSSLVKARYDLYLKTFSGVVQSVSISRKEEKNSKMAD